MSDRQKVQKVVAEGVVDSEGYLLRKNGNFFKLPGLAEKDVKVIVFVEPKMIRPDGVRWVLVDDPDSTIHGHSLLQLGNGSLVDRVFFSNFGWRSKDQDSPEETLGLAQRTVEERLANAGLHGFGWE